ncbi:MAG TPA: hypothetical protein V6C78_07355 [Crinalium sp.]|jgi:hypothetical protein
MPQTSELRELRPDPQAVSESCAKADYRGSLSCWAIARHIPDSPPTIVARFRTRSDADGHLKLLHRQIPDGTFEVVFDAHKS